MVGKFLYAYKESLVIYSPSQLCVCVCMPSNRYRVQYTHTHTHYFSGKSQLFCHLTLKALNAGAEGEKSDTLLHQELEKKFGQSPVFVASTLLEDGGTPKSASLASLLKEAIHVISCGYEVKTEWGKEVRSMFEILY